jgi:hypothetical protein
MKILPMMVPLNLRPIVEATSPRMGYDQVRLAYCLLNRDLNASSDCKLFSKSERFDPKPLLLKINLHW